MKMMETKVLAALCTLLIIHLGSADQGHTATAAPSAPAGSDGSAAESLPASAAVSGPQVVTSQQLNDSEPGPGPSPSPSSANSLSTSPVEEEKKKENGSVTAPPQGSAASNIVNASTAAPERSATQPSPPSSPAASNTSTIGVPPVSTGSTELPDHTRPANVTVTSAPSLNASADSGNHTKANSSAEVAPTGTPRTGTNSSSTSTGAATTPTSSPTAPSSLSSTTPPSTTNPTTPTPSTTTTTPPISATKSSSAVSSTTTTTTTTSSSSSTQGGKGHVASPSQINNEDTKMVPDSPTIDPLLAALVSAFIISAVIIILLLFLKLRKRGNQPEFRRLQDLPMDDMMEDTPLSMYSY